MGTRLEFLAVTVGTVLIAHIAQAADTPRNVILFVPDGLRALAVTPETAIPSSPLLRCRTLRGCRPGINWATLGLLATPYSQAIRWGLRAAA